MILVDKDIRQLIDENRIGVLSTRADQPFDANTQIGSASIDLRLSNNFIRFKSNISEVSFQEKNAIENFVINDQDFLVINPNEMIQASTLEIVQLPGDIAMFVTGRSSVARLGLMVQATQDFIQPGSKALIPLQLVNVSGKIMKIPPLFRICQVVLFQTNSSTTQEYSRLPNAKYKNEIFGIQGSKLYTEAANLPSQISEIQAAKRQISEKEIEERKSLVDKANKTSELMDRVRALLFAVYLVLGAAVGTLLSEIGKDIFPSITFIVSSSLAVFCVFLIGLAHWRR